MEELGISIVLGGFTEGGEEAVTQEKAFLSGEFAADQGEKISKVRQCSQCSRVWGAVSYKDESHGGVPRYSETIQVEY